MLSEIQEKIYENFPKVKKDDEDEKLSGAKIYISNVCFKYNSRDSIEANNQPDKIQSIQNDIKNTDPISIVLNNLETQVNLL